jgi:hypothetical protein
VDKNRFSIIADCDEYNDVNSSTTALTCKTCSGTTKMIPFCTVADTLCGAGQKKSSRIYNSEVQDVCLKTSSIAYCELYKTVLDDALKSSQAKQGNINSCGTC